MENKIRFRNHISVILEQLGATFGILFVLFFTNIDDVIDILKGVIGRIKSHGIYWRRSDIGSFSADIFISVDHLVEDLHFDL